ncbi:hypothetical protein [Thiolapillus sp.]|uniref:hypothetical protein n=1 Tax=Thiolapillus sp. TaxID=2017437 RepID=UPI003AF543C6
MAAIVLLPSLNAVADVTLEEGNLQHFVEYRNIVAATVWDSKNIYLLANNPTQLANLASVDTVSDRNTFLAPTALIFAKKTGELKRTITFFDEECPYKPVALVIKGNKLTMTVQVSEPLIQTTKVSEFILPTIFCCIRCPTKPQDAAF